MTYIIDLADRTFGHFDSLDARIVRDANTRLGAVAQLDGLLGGFGVSDKEVGARGHAF
jgi:hypothetical protein